MHDIGIGVAVKNIIVCKHKLKLSCGRVKQKMNGHAIDQDGLEKPAAQNESGAWIDTVAMIYIMQFLI